MNKAFTKEDDYSEEDSVDASEEQALPQGIKNYITPQGLARLKEELHRLLYEERPALVRTVSWAASNGDRSENGDYIYGKRRLREIDRRIRFLSKRIEIAVVVDPVTQKTDRVLFATSVVVQDEDGKKRKYRIVGIDEANPSRGEISWISPMAKALLNAKVGDLVSLKTPRGEEELEVLQISNSL